MAGAVRQPSEVGAGDTVEIAAGDVLSEMTRRGIGADEPVLLTIRAERDLVPGRRASRARVVAAGLTDDDIDQLIKQAQKDVEQPRE